MAQTTLDHDPRVGARVHIFSAHFPSSEPLHGDLVTLERLAPHHTDDLFESMGGTLNEGIWTFAHQGPFLDVESWRAWLGTKMDPDAGGFLWAIVDNKTKTPFGTISIHNMELANRVCELGFLYTPLSLSLTRSTIEAMYLLLRYVFEDLGFRRLGWQINALNEPAKRVMLRLGFVYEGTLRQREIVKGFNRDTSHYSIVQEEWPVCKWAFRRWLMQENFDDKGRQRKTLGELRDSRRSMHGLEGSDR